MDLNYLKQQIDKGTISKDSITVVRRDGELIDIHLLGEPISADEVSEVMDLESVLSEVFNLAPNFAPKV
ncbi:Paratox [Streptococcus acidominimus]|uniref:Paratox n=1 Tax=Streptococcus acidominimus TaxID=1326 RepID=A0A239X0S7_STRAI|nr:Paratox [Streptococcus acidominimus]SNV40010.1 Paratox [Streptococcus acidominimus]